MTVMKKIFYLLSFCALAFISCQKEEMTGNDPVSGKYSYEFTAYQQPEAKATIGDKTDGKWPVLWSVGDQMGVYKADGTFVGVATIADECAGLNEGKFSVLSDVALAEGDALYFSYPYVENAAISTGKIAAKQTLGASGVGANAVAYAEVEYNPGNTQFVLNHTNAYLKFNIKSEEFAGYNLNGVTLWATGAELSGDVAIADQLTVTNAGDYVKSTLATPVAVSADNAQAVWVTALPGDLAGKTVYAIVHMSGVAGTETATHTVTLPVKLNGAGALPSGSVTEITLPSLTKSLAPAWYEPVETRYIAAYGDGWSYGPENTVRFTSYKTAQTVDLKARGNFMKVREPKSVLIQYISGIKKPATGTINIDGTVAAQYAAAGDTFTEIELQSGKYSVDVILNNYSNDGGARGHIAGMLVKDKDKNTIWGINLWLTLQELTTVAYDNGTVMDRNLGTDECPDRNTWRNPGGFFQWGRPFAFQSQQDSYGRKYFKSADSKVVTDLSVSAANPYTLYYHTAGAPYHNRDWHYGDGTDSPANDYDDLWGNPDSTTGRGQKSIYDPCPKGYMVTSYAILKEVIDNAVYVTDPLPRRLVYKGVGWGFHGGYTCDGYNYGFNWKLTDSFCGHWSNTNVNDYARPLFTSGPNDEGKLVFDSQYSKVRALPVRCMVDTENR